MCIHIQMISFYKHWFSVEKTLATRNNGVLWGRTGSSETWYGEFLHWIYFCLFFLKISLFLVVLGLRCCAWAFSSCGARASHCGGFSCCGAWALGFRGFNSWGWWAQPLWRMGLAAPCHVGRSQRRDQTHASCISRWISTTGPPGKPHFCTF